MPKFRVNIDISLDKLQKIISPFKKNPQKNNPKHVVETPKPPDIPPNKIHLNSHQPYPSINPTKPPDNNKNNHHDKP